MKEKTPLSHRVVCFKMLDFETSKSNSEVLKLMENYCLSEGVVSQNVLYNQQLPITRYHVSFYAERYFD